MVRASLPAATKPGSPERTFTVSISKHTAPAIPYPQRKRGDRFIASPIRKDREQNRHVAQRAAIPHVSSTKITVPATQIASARRPRRNNSDARGGEDEEEHR